MKTPLSLLMGLCLAMASCSGNEDTALPNIIYILADDLGMGDVSACNPEAAWTTPAMDQIAAEGMLFTDAHSGSAVCTPTRYGVLTGRYSWRTSLKSGVLWSWSPMLIGKDEATVASLLKSQGYHTACIGKWHLGLGWQFFEEGRDSADFSKALTAGPLDLGFDEFFGICASLDIPPYVWIDQDQSTTVPTRYTQNTGKQSWWRRGLTGDDFRHEEVLDVLSIRAVAYVRERAADQRKATGKPFFLYFPLPAPHTPILPSAEFAGKSGTNDYGDFVLEVDHAVRRILDVLREEGLAENTLLVFTSDNGCSPEADFEELAGFGHDPSHKYRGHKADIYEGGHRVPFLVRWPGQVEAGSRSDRTICLTDFFATAAEVCQLPAPMEGGADSFSLMPILRGKGDSYLRESTVHHSVNGSFAIRSGHWKLIFCPGSGGWSFPRPGKDRMEGLPEFQLYHLKDDPGEEVNLYAEHPDKAESLRLMMEELVQRGRSTEGPSLAYVEVENWPGLRWMKP